MQSDMLRLGAKMATVTGKNGYGPKLLNLEPKWLWAKVATAIITHIYIEIQYQYFNKITRVYQM